MTRLPTSVAGGALLVFAGLAVFESWGMGLLVPTLARRLELELSQRISLPVTIRSIHGGVIRPVSFRGVRLGDRLAVDWVGLSLRWWDLLRPQLPQAVHLRFVARDLAMGPGAQVTSLEGHATIRGELIQVGKVKGRLWGLPLRASGVIPFAPRRGGLDLLIATQGGPFGGTWRLTGSLAQPDVQGEMRIGALILPVSGRVVCESRTLVRFDVATADEQRLHGHVDLVKQEVRGLAWVRWAAQALPYTVSWGSDRQVVTVVELKEAMLGKHRLTGLATIAIDMSAIAQAPRRLFTRVQVDQVEWDGYPSYAIRGQLRWEEEQLIIDRFHWGSIYEVSGKVRTEFPGEIQLMADIVGADLSRGEGIFFPPKRMAGMMDGALEVSGVLPFPQVTGDLVLRDGHFGRFGYERCMIKMRGTWPLVQVEDSQIGSAQRWLKLQGQVDLRRLHHGELLRQLVAKADQEVIWQGWDVIREMASDEVHLARQLGRFRVNLTKDEDTSFTYQEMPKDVELDYQVNEQEQMKLKMQGEERFLGVERKVKW